MPRDARPVNPRVRTDNPDPPAAYAGLDLLATAVLLLEREGRVVWANAAAENLFGMSRAMLVRRTLVEALGPCVPLGTAVRRAIVAGASYTEQELEIRATGKPPLHLCVTATPIDVGSATLALEFRLIDRELRAAREERLNEQQQANRELIRSLAHEIKKPLGGIRGAAQLLERELDRPPLIEYTQVIIGEADRLQSLVNRLLTPHRLPTVRATNVHEILVRVKNVVQAEFPQLPITCDFDISLPEIDADAEQLTQAVMNVVRNAAQALAGAVTEPRITLRTRVARNVTLARRFHRLALAIDVDDNGPGIPESIRGRIFYPLVSGREGGSGLGLTIAQTYVAQHGGTIECESRPGRTTFTIRLPIEASRAAA